MTDVPKQQRQRADVTGPQRADVSPIRGGDLCHAQAFGHREYGGVDSTQRKVGVFDHNLNDPAQAARPGGGFDITVSLPRYGRPFGFTAGT